MLASITQTQEVSGNAGRKVIYPVGKPMIAFRSKTLEREFAEATA